jgi:hypothetical protein
LEKSYRKEEDNDDDDEEEEEYVDDCNDIPLRQRQ